MQPNVTIQNTITAISPVELIVSNTMPIIRVCRTHARARHRTLGLDGEGIWWKPERKKVAVRMLKELYMTLSRDEDSHAAKYF